LFFCQLRISEPKPENVPQTQTFDFETGELILIDKPKGLTSFDVVARVRNATGVRKVGHGGTLDPLATGLLIIGTGSKTKELGQLQNDQKEYIFELRFGYTTASYDAEQEAVFHADASQLTPDSIEEALKAFRGTIEQYPPDFSAIKVEGEPAYKSARKGKDLELKARTVEIERYDLLHFVSSAQVVFRVSCSKGTYIRSLGHDLGQALGVGAYVTELQRTKIADWKLEDAWPLEEFLTEARSQTGRKAPPPRSNDRDIVAAKSPTDSDATQTGNS